jgi:uncharacterized protein YdaU (DUF1376 family)
VYPDVKVVSRTLQPGIDVKGHGGFVVAPPSQHASGKTYRWVDPNAAVAEAPEWLIQLVSDQKQKPTLGGIETAHVEDVIFCKGQRHNKLVSMGGGLRASGMEEAAINELLQVTNTDCCQPPLSNAEVSKIAGSVSKYETGKKKSSYDARRAAREKALPYFPLYTNDWLNDREVLYMDAEERGLYFMLVFEAWRSAGILENEPDKLWRLARAESFAAFERKQKNILTKFDSAIDEDGKPVLIHRVLEALWKRQHQTWKKRVQAGKASSEQRAEKQREQVAA